MSEKVKRFLEKFSFNVSRYTLTNSGPYKMQADRHGDEIFTLFHGDEIFALFQEQEKKLARINGLDETLSKCPDDFKTAEDIFKAWKDSQEDWTYLKKQYREQEKKLEEARGALRKISMMSGYGNSINAQRIARETLNKDK